MNRACNRILGFARHTQLMSWRVLIMFGFISLTACATPRPYPPHPGPYTPPPAGQPTPDPVSPAPLTPRFIGPQLPDTIIFSQKDPRWAHHAMGGSGASLENEGCLVTATSMALTNLGHPIDPSRLNSGLKTNKGYTGSGLLIWNAIDRVTNQQMTSRFYKDYHVSHIDQCLADGFYPLTRFRLPSGRTHWGMVLGRTDKGFRMRDPLHVSAEPLIFPNDGDGFTAVRCVGRK